MIEVQSNFTFVGILMGLGRGRFDFNAHHGCNTSIHPWFDLVILFVQFQQLFMN